MLDSGRTAVSLKSPVSTATLPAPTLAIEKPSARQPLEEAIDRARRHLLSLQRDDGHWCAELEGDTILESEYLMLLHFLGLEDDQRFASACLYLRQRQLEEGGWAIYPGGPPDPSPSVKAYFALKLYGDDPEAEHMKRARESIRRMGGIARCNSFTKLYLAMFGVWRWQDAPSVPPELILLPNWFYFNIYEMSSWSRAIVVPLSIIWALKPKREVSFSLDELLVDREFSKPGSNWRERFCFALCRGVDRGIKVADRAGLFRPVRQQALRKCERWTLERLEDSAGLGAIYPSIMNSVIALSLRGHTANGGVIGSQLEELEKLEIVEGPTGEETLRLQPCCSPVWDTALSMNGLLKSELDPHDPAIQRAATWLLDREVRSAGDWQVKNPDVEPGGWYFEYANEFYPDCDDTGEIIAVLGRLRLDDERQEARRKNAVRRALCWQLAMQNRDGGWGAFDRECTKELLTYIPFADHNAMIDPSTPDITARTLEALVDHLGTDHGVVRRGIRFLLREQESDGSWHGRWGSNYLYGTWLALCALAAVGKQRDAASMRGVEWLLSVQNEDGGWGETLQSYVDPSLKGQGPSTAAQTSWAMMGLLATVGDDLEANRRISGAMERACTWLLDRQETEGGWQDTQWTGTGFPEVFYLRYHYYDRYFPLQALAAYQRAARHARSPAA